MKTDMKRTPKSAIPRGTSGRRLHHNRATPAFHYHEPMTTKRNKITAYQLVFRPVRRLLVAAIATGISCASLAQAENTAPTPSVVLAKANSELSGPLFYQLLLGELKAQDEDPGAAYSLILDAARRHHSEQLYRRAVEIALQARNGELALIATQAWGSDLKDSVEAHRFELQILLALNRIEEVAPVLRTVLQLTPEEERVDAINSIPQVFSRVTDKNMAVDAVRKALTPSTGKSKLAAAAWTSIGRVEMDAGLNEAALTSAQKGHQADPASPFPALLALELLESGVKEAEPVVLRQMSASSDINAKDGVVPMAYARVLLDLDREREALKLMSELTRQQPDRADAWLLLGTLQQQARDNESAKASLQRYLDLTSANPQSRTRQGLTQAYLLLAQVAEQQGDLAGAERWLGKIENADDILAAQMRRASLLARQGKMDQARQLLRNQPVQRELDERTKLVAEAQLLRDFQQWNEAFAVYAQAITKFPNDEGLRYEQAIVAERAGRLDDMERILRELIALKPDYHHAYNALGYSLADRSVRLPEARQLILKAAELSPDDAFIQDSLGWVEFRMGNLQESLRILRTAYSKRHDAEIAAHLGEVLWAAGEKEEARKVWREAMLKAADNETLQSTLKRLNVQP